jgi:hypothetical protein
LAPYILLPPPQIFSPGNPSAPPRLLFDRSYEDVYSDPGSPFSRKTALGTGVLAEVRGGKADHPRLLFSGNGATPDGDRPFLDLFDLETKEAERVWQCGTEEYFEGVVALMSDKKPEVWPAANALLVRYEALKRSPSERDHSGLLVTLWPCLSGAVRRKGLGAYKWTKSRNCFWYREVFV